MKIGRTSVSARGSSKKNGLLTGEIRSPGLPQGWSLKARSLCRQPPHRLLGSGRTRSMVRSQNPLCSGRSTGTPPGGSGSGPNAGGGGGTAGPTGTGTVGAGTGGAAARGGGGRGGGGGGAGRGPPGAAGSRGPSGYAAAVTPLPFATAAGCNGE